MPPAFLLPAPLLYDLLQLLALLLLDHAVELDLLVLCVFLHLFDQLFLYLGVQELLYLLQLLGLLPDYQHFRVLLAVEQVDQVCGLPFLSSRLRLIPASGQLFVGFLLPLGQNLAYVLAPFVGELKLNNLLVGTHSLIGDLNDRLGALGLSALPPGRPLGFFPGVVLLQIAFVLLLLALVEGDLVEVERRGHALGDLRLVAVEE